jgi:hypothetical protein
MSTGVYTGLNQFNFTPKHFLQICLWDVSYARSYWGFEIITCAWVITIHWRVYCSGGVRSGEQGGHKFVEMTRSPKISFWSVIEFLAVCAVAPSCWNRADDFVFLKEADEIVEHWTVTFNVHCFFKSFNCFRTALCAVASPIPSSCVNLSNDFDELRRTTSHC